MESLTLIKIGGSLVACDQGLALRRLGKEIGRVASAHRLAIIPGGGPFADTVREYGKRLGLSQEVCHFMALLAMDQYGYLLKEVIPGSRLQVLDSSAHQITSSSISSPTIWLCSQLVGRVPKAVLPRSWQVTSDSIAAYLAERWRARLLVLVKSVDVSFPLREPDVDGFFSQLLPLPCPVWIINGRHPERLAELLETGKTEGLVIPPEPNSSGVGAKLPILRD